VLGRRAYPITFWFPKGIQCRAPPQAYQIYVGGKILKLFGPWAPSLGAPEPLRGSLWQARSAYGGPPGSGRGFFCFLFLEIWGSLSGSLGEPIRYFLGTEFERIFLGTAGKPSEALLGCSDPPFGVAFRRYLGRPGVLDFDNRYNAKP